METRKLIVFSLFFVFSFYDVYEFVRMCFWQAHKCYDYYVKRTHNGMDLFSLTDSLYISLYVFFYCLSEVCSFQCTPHKTHTCTADWRVDTHRFRWAIWRHNHIHDSTSTTNQQLIGYTHNCIPIVPIIRNFSYRWQQNQTSAAIQLSADRNCFAIIVRSMNSQRV